MMVPLLATRPLSRRALRRPLRRIIQPPLPHPIVVANCPFQCPLRRSSSGARTARAPSSCSIAAEEVRARIDYWVQRKEDMEKEKDTSLQERLKLREEEREKELEIRREKRRAEAEKKREAKEEAVKVKTEYGEDVRIEGEHDEDDMMAAMGITGFGTSKK